MTQPSAEQLRVIGAPLAPLSVVACAGSGKTFTAVRRLTEIRLRMGNQRGRVALLSFSNIAIETFRREYQGIVGSTNSDIPFDRVEIDTLDSFITRNVLRPHAHRTMGCDRTPFLLAGTESFLQNKELKFWAQPSGKSGFPVDPTSIHKVVINLIAGRPTFHLRSQNIPIPITNGAAVVSRLGALGAYTHDFGRYWCHCTLTRQPSILRALVCRYPHILIDEAQDVGTTHQAIIEQLIGAGSQVSLIGDPNQAIYEFAGADGTFLTRYGEREGVVQLKLTRNYRSVPAVVELANQLSARVDTADRTPPETTHGGYFIGYRGADLENLFASFHSAVLAAGLKLDRSAVLCRGRQLADKLSGSEGAPGQGSVKRLAQAAILRDRNRDYRGAFRLVVASIVGLLASPPHGLAARVLRPDRDLDGSVALRRLVWAYTRNPDAGLPAAALVADSEWHPLMLERTRVLLAQIARRCGLVSAENLGHKLTRKGLPRTPLIPVADLTASDATPRIRFDTVHQAKGESLDAVLYLAAKREHANALLTGVGTEVGRIGYVAVTRARNLLWVGVPANALAELRPALLARGFLEAGAAPPA